MILDIDVPLYQGHAVVVETVSNILDLLTLELEPRILRLLFCLRLANQLLQIMDFFC